MKRKEKSQLFSTVSVSRYRLSFRPGSPEIGGTVEVNGTSETKRQAEVEDPTERRPVGTGKKEEEKQEKDESEKENKACEEEGLKERAPGKPEGIGGHVYKRELQR